MASVEVKTAGRPKVVYESMVALAPAEKVWNAVTVNRPSSSSSGVAVTTVAEDRPVRTTTFTTSTGAPEAIGAHTITVRHVSQGAAPSCYLEWTVEFPATATDFDVEAARTKVIIYMTAMAAKTGHFQRLHESKSAYVPASPTRIFPRYIGSTWSDGKWWDNFPFRENDLLLCCFPKCGTNWTFQIFSQLVLKGKEPELKDGRVVDGDRWIDSNRSQSEQEYFKWAESIPSPRVFVTHSALSAQKFDPRVKYLVLVRDGRDAAFSGYSMQFTITDAVRDAIKLGHRLSWAEYWPFWLRGDNGFPFFFNMLSFWNYRHLPNVKLLHFNDLKKDLKGEMRKLAQWANIVLTEEELASATEHSTFEYMKKNESKWIIPGAMESGSFVNKGENGRWQEVMTWEQHQQYHEHIQQWFPADLAAFVLSGVPSDPNELKSKGIIKLDKDTKVAAVASEVAERQKAPTTSSASWAGKF